MMKQIKKTTGPKVSWSIISFITNSHIFLCLVSARFKFVEDNLVCTADSAVPIIIYSWRKRLSILGLFSENSLFHSLSQSQVIMQCICRFVVLFPIDVKMMLGFQIAGWVCYWLTILKGGQEPRSTPETYNQSRIQTWYLSILLQKRVSGKMKIYPKNAYAIPAYLVLKDANLGIQQPEFF